MSASWQNPVSSAGDGADGHLSVQAPSPGNLRQTGGFSLPRHCRAPVLPLRRRRRRRDSRVLLPALGTGPQVKPWLWRVNCCCWHRGSGALRQGLRRAFACGSVRGCFVFISLLLKKKTKPTKHKIKQTQYNTLTQLFSYIKRCLSVRNIAL